MPKTKRRKGHWRETSSPSFYASLRRRGYRDSIRTLGVGECVLSATDLANRSCLAQFLASPIEGRLVAKAITIIGLAIAARAIEIGIGLVVNKPEAPIS